VVFAVSGFIPSLCCPQSQKDALLQFKSLLFAKYDSSDLDSWNSSSSDCCQWKRVTCGANTTSKQVSCLDPSQNIKTRERKDWDSWFSLKMTIPGYAVGLLCTISGFYVPGFFRIPPRKRPRISIRQLREALLQFKSLIFPKYDSSDLNSWNSSSSDCCQWKRVTCSGTNVAPKQVIGLSLNFVGASYFPSDALSPLFLLRSLVHLDVSSNDIEGNSPGVGLANLTALVKLDMSANKFNGSLPGDLFSLSKLEFLDLTDNMIKGHIPNDICNLSKLASLYLNDNHFYGAIHPSLQKLENLKTLHLGGNKLTGEIPTWLFNFTSLTKLNVGGNNLIWKDQRVAPNSMLSLLSLRSCNISGEIPIWLSNQTNLNVLDLSDHNLVGTYPQWLAESKATTISLSGNFPSFHPASLLAYVGLGLNKFVGALPQSLENLKSLYYLDLGDNNFTGEIPPIFSRFSVLRVLNLRNNSLQSPLDRFPNAGYIQVLDLSYNFFTGKIPAGLGTFSTFVGGQFSVVDIINEHLMLLELQYPNLDLVSKHRKYRYGVKFLELVSLLDLSNNQLSGKIPESLGYATSLRLLNVSYNILTGGIPTTLGNIRVLETLNLSHNSLSREIPPNFGELYSLSVLDLSNNNLTGPIPTGHQFDTFQVESFANNSGLCGSPIKVSCDEPSLETRPKENKDWERWFSWKMAIPGYAVGLLCIVSGFYAFGFFRIPPRKRRRISFRQLKDALLQFKSLLFPEYDSSDLASWNSSSSDCCQWERVTCNSFNAASKQVPFSHAINLLHLKLKLCKQHWTVSCPEPSLETKPKESKDWDSWFSWKMAILGYAVGLLCTFSGFYVSGNESFANNSGLCGIQVGISCEPSQNTKLKESKDWDSWFSWKMAVSGYPVGLLCTISGLYLSGFFRIPPQKERLRISIRQLA
ncbi:hypothetical protein Tsubulata_046734, partial [Turnera subulata]